MEDKRQNNGELAKSGALKVGLGDVDFIYVIVRLIAVIELLAFVGLGVFIIAYSRLGFSVTIPPETPATVAAQITALLA